MDLSTHCARIEMERDMETGHREIVRVPYGYRILLEAAILGTRMEELPRVLQDDPVDQVMWVCRGKDNPLHVGALYGNVEFVTEILNRKPELTRELNSEGKSPLHLASERGHFEVVKEILRKDTNACFIRDRDGMIPLHLAAINGRVEVLEELVNAEKITAFILTKGGEPIPHLCAKKNKFKALEKLIDLVEEKDRLVNLRDRDDNTILHLLSAKDSLEVIKLLVDNSHNIKEVVNAKNTDGFTPLDISFQQKTNIWREYKIQRLLIKKGAQSDGFRSLVMGLIKMIKNPGNDDGRFGEALMVVAVLMATVAFQAGLSPPGDVWHDTTFNDATLPNVTQSSLPPNLVPQYAGKSIMSYVDPSRYNYFSICNDVTLALSLLVIQLLLAGYLFKSRSLQLIAVMCTALSLLTLSLTYCTSVAFISLHKQLIPILVVISSMMLYICLSFSELLLPLLVTSRAPPRQPSQESDSSDYEKLQISGQASDVSSRQSLL